VGRTRYLIALGSNMRHPRHGGPAAVLRAAVAALDRAGLTVEAESPLMTSAPLGPSRRRYANGVALVASDLDPPALLRALQAIEHAFDRKRRGMRWQARTLDLDIVLWEGGCWRDAALTIPHREFRTRHFVLSPALTVAADWRDPITGLTVRHLYARLTRRPPHPR
jgi:2-amino-4-hydroxy-6-hydroxymethyldihydropteridine diphosphokinase